ncbi:fumarylacetoacetate hydrolase family protein [Paraglaciecola arctica]|uniref:Fumarylacetoacetate hydrolase domain-containing protein 1 n=1 Tax=Paraglaciecola arctica BSs20135 TaxID=493475 RepID=K6ZAE8_9ALTE|nr:fumarylacetoacetate hydrolase family protein [Paraglaciecola arctica]GAC20410.1 fumarylacetoacetate hydrolase domain-containing protein 1 [Paraglaciecola arctica BSs20135]
MLEYKHIDSDGKSIDLPVGKVVCVGRNYLQHIKELENEVPSEPLLFIKPSTALSSLIQPVVIPKNLGPCHNELELAVLIKTTLCQASIPDAEAAIWGIGLGLDLTLRDVQTALKKQGHPWERAKSFDRSCPMSQFVAKEQFDTLSDIDFSLRVNNEIRQQGNSQEMLFPILNLLTNMSNAFTLLPGDIVMTGTPKGVAALSVDDQLNIELNKHFSVNTCVV